MKRIVVWVRVWVFVGVLATLCLVWGLRNRAPVEQPLPVIPKGQQAPAFVLPADYVASAEIPAMEISPEDLAEAGRERSDNGVENVVLLVPARPISEWAMHLESAGSSQTLFRCKSPSAMDSGLGNMR